MTDFKASVQYGDWKGTAAADNADQGWSLDEYLEKKGLKQANEFLIATSLWVGENHVGKLGSLQVRALLYAGHVTFDTVKVALAADSGSIPVRIVDIELNLEQYIGLFKRFDVMLTRRGLGLEGRDYVEA